jgi:hypothetical protein
MENKFVLVNDGQALLQADLNQIGDSAGMADDRVYAELFRLPPGNGSTVTKGVLPSSTGPLIAAATGSVNVPAFRAFVGSRTAPATNAKKSYRDSQSGLSVTDASTALATNLPIAPNASGNARWDAIIAAVTTDAPVSTVLRKVKSPTTGIVADTSVAAVFFTSVVLSVVTGTPAPSNLFPATPADSAPTYYVLLGYVRVPTGFTSASVVSQSLDIAITAPVLALTRATGGLSASVADQSTVLNTLYQAQWGPLGGRPNRYVPSTMTGGDTIWVLLDLLSPLLTQQSHQDGDVIDSRDWRKRFCTFTCSISPLAGIACWDRGPSPANCTPNGFPQGFAAASNRIGVGVGQSMTTDAALVAGTSTPFQISNGVSTNLGVTQLGIVCDMATGQLKLFTGGGNARSLIVVRLDFSGPFAGV